MDGDAGEQRGTLAGAIRGIGCFGVCEADRFILKPRPCRK